jgi:hypothetical protein
MTDSSSTTRFQARKARSGWYVQDSVTGDVWTGLSRPGVDNLIGHLAKDRASAPVVTAVADEPATADEPGQQPLWVEMMGADFGESRGPVQGSLFQAPDACGTLDLFAAMGE